ncbi:hypothetical protein GJAV_G00238560 [Gymnothorax javanicus]|nr:hypothetical protein GJAV_G00238560 [Gymnothorax javanicus]
MAESNTGRKEDLEEKICDFLRRQKNGANLKALEIAKGVGLTRGKDVNATLYRLEGLGRLRKTGESPPLWSLPDSCVPTMENKTPDSSISDLRHGLRTLLTLNSASEGVSAKKLARDLNQSRRAVNSQLYDMHSRGEVKKIGPHNDHSLWRLVDQDGNKTNQSEPEKESVDKSSDSDTLSSQPAASRFSEDYNFIARLGEGGYGAIYQVKQKLDKRDYAIKVVEYDDDEFALREVEALAHFQHPNIVRYYTAWREPSRPQLGESSSDEEEESESLHAPIRSKKCAPREYLYIQMEFCDGGTLTAWIAERNNRKTRDKMEILDVFQKIVLGVEYIHTQDHIHRDLKPDNILFKRDGTVKIGDFGLVTTIKSKSGRSIERTKGVGTTSYMSPEQENQSSYDEKVDIFALGLIFFELLWRIGTGMERAKLWDSLRNGLLPDDFCEEHAFHHMLIKKMLSKVSRERPGAKDIAKHLTSQPEKQSKESIFQPVSKTV